MTSGATADQQSVLKGYDDDMIALSDQAIEWLVRLQSGDASDVERQAFEHWRAQSNDHARAVREAELLFGAVDETEVARNWSGLDHDLAMASLTLASTSVSRPATRRKRPMTGHMSFVPKRWGVMAGSLCAVLALTIIGSLQGQDLWARWNADYSTAIGVSRTITLPDGTVAHLNTSSAFSIDFSGDIRQVNLAAGEVIFDVAKDASHPFIVTARDGASMAVGTVYGVRIEDDCVGVTVQEGVVEVSNQSGSSVRLNAGEQAYYQDGTVPKLVEDADLAAYGSWQRGKLIFNNRPLGDVIDEVQRYKSERIVIARDALRNLRVTGVFETAELDELLNSLEQTTGAKLVRLPLLTVIY
ncbi:FecR family protein [Thalassospira sp. CH_XMU1448-2]|uniref:FecR family protein n=1 Tax=Thalassospira sp. CH_XMU1448-2 TaxID=3107773 RepID=UPI003009990F